MPIIGAEDLAIDFATNTLFISAYDRRASERAAKKKSSKAIPTGGLYSININSLRDHNRPTLLLKSLIPADNIDGGLRPHGIFYDPNTQQLSFINRGFYRDKKKWTMSPKLERININELQNTDISSPLVGPRLCAANNLIVIGERALISFDHRNCNWRGVVENILNSKKSGLMFSDASKAEFTKAGLANGVVETLNGTIALAATREKKLYFFNTIKNHLNPISAISLPGGPDNLTLSFDGAIIAAVHPSLLRMGLHRKLGWGKSPSKIIRIDPLKKTVTTLFTDPKGKFISAATVGIETNDALILGSVTQAGLLVCEKTSYDN